MKVMELAGKLGGDIEAAIRQLARGRCTAPRAGRRFQTNLKISES